MKKPKMYHCVTVAAIAAALAMQAPASVLGGTWQEEQDGWSYLEDGARQTNQWVRDSKNRFYYLDQEGRMAVDRLVADGDDRLYYVDNAGIRVKNEWKQVGATDDNGVYEEPWYYFNGNGLAVKGKKVIGDKKYLFDEKGRMLTGWVRLSDRVAEPFTESLEDKDGDIYYCLETGGAVDGWQQLYPPDEEETQGGVERWYNFDKGKVRTNEKKGLDGKDYIFGKDGAMITGWAYDNDGTWTAVDEEVDGGDIESYQEDVTKFYYAGEDGSLAKDCWVEVENYDGLTGSGDEDKSWYYFDRKGRVTGRQATASPSDAMEVADTSSGSARLRVHKGNKGKYEVKTGDGVLNDDAPTVVIKEVDDKYYMFNAKGRLTDGLVYLPKSVGRFRQGYYNFDDDKALKTGEMVLEDGGTNYYYYFAKDKDSGYALGQGVTGIYGGRLYYEGLAVTAVEGTGWQVAYIEPRDGHRVSGLFLVDETGKVKTGGAVESEEGLQYKVSKPSGRDPRKTGYTISARSSDEGYKGMDGYEQLDQEDASVLPDESFTYDEDTDKYYPEGAFVDNSGEE